ncbi:MAG: 30S ribosomal protein S20 [Candidatus Omnitrophica bacterium]|nr:30S ribosomal protein S20 [Candidatus Omnitrophota bacterium]
MPIKKSAVKELKKSKKRQEHNIALKKSLKKEEKLIAGLIESKDVEKLKKGINAFVSCVDKAVGKKIIHKNKASRKKSRILKKIHQLSAK